MSTILKKTILALSCLCLFPSCSVLVGPIAGSFKESPKTAKKNLSPEANQLIDQSFKGLENQCMVDFHVHAVGVGAGNTGAWVNPGMSNWLNPKSYLKYNVYMSAGGITDVSKADQQYIERLVELVRLEKRYGRLLLFAFDYHYLENGEVLKEKSTFYIPNDYVYKMAKKYPDVFIPVMSVHPYKKDAHLEVEKWAKKGVKFIKWLPNAQRIHPSIDRLNPYYEIMKKYGVTLITHTGHEKAVEGEEFQQLANPFHLRKPLDMGIKIMMAHLASLGECKDLDNDGKNIHCFDAFWRMFKNPKYKGLLYGELSGTTIYTRMGHPMDKLLENPELQSRVVNGSDYPLPAINILYRTGQYKDMGYISGEEAKALNEIYKYNPLLFDFVVKRTLKHPKSGVKLLNEAFMVPKEIGCPEVLN